MFSSIRIRLTFSHLVVIVLAMSLSGILLLSFLEDYFAQATEDSLIAQARITAQALIPEVILAGPVIEAQSSLSNAIQQQQVSNLSLQTENVDFPLSGAEQFDSNDLADASLQLGAQLETRIRILDTQGLVLMDSWKSDLDKDFSSDPVVALAMAGEYASWVDGAGKDSVMYLAMPAFVNKNLVGVIYLSQPMRDVIRVLGDLRTRLWISTAIAVVFSAIVGLMFSGAITRPLGRLTAAASTIAQGYFDQQLHIRSRDELGTLGRAFDDMTARLQAARKMQVDFVANVSHELRTPLTSIKGMVETLRGGAVDDHEVRDDFLETIDTETDRLVRLVNDLLLLSQIDSQALNLQCESLDLGELIHSIVTNFQHLAESKGLSISTKVHSEAPLVWADPDRIEQVLINLLDNACKYSPSRGTIIVGVDIKDDQFVQVQVHDEGTGILAQDLPKIGQRFFRTDDARSRSQGGSGLGLAIVKSLVEAHGGIFWLESQEGEGTVASFTLPIV